MCGGDCTCLTRFRGWVRPGPVPPGAAVRRRAAGGETLDYISGHFRLFQLRDGHRFSTDDVLTAWYGTTGARRRRPILDLGSGIGSVATIAAWRLPGARLVTVEAQEVSVALARKSARFNGLEERCDIRPRGLSRSRTRIAGRTSDSISCSAARRIFRSAAASRARTRRRSRAVSRRAATSATTAASRRGTSRRADSSRAFSLCRTASMRGCGERRRGRV